MPFVRVTFVEGPDLEAQARLVDAITASVVEQLRVPRASVSVVLDPVRADQWSVGGTFLSETLGG